eukprot:Mrub_14971.p1 GENE.Mrub_14971~~Mrub_14971.p1  ORF type:complete len:106 (-),score=3.36 Mrub_14971:89-406(-)
MDKLKFLNFLEDCLSLEYLQRKKQIPYKYVKMHLFERVIPRYRNKSKTIKTGSLDMKAVLDFSKSINIDKIDFSSSLKKINKHSDIKRVNGKIKNSVEPKSAPLK